MQYPSLSYPFQFYCISVFSIHLNIPLKARCKVRATEAELEMKVSCFHFHFVILLQNHKRQRSGFLQIAKGSAQKATIFPNMPFLSTSPQLHNSFMPPPLLLGTQKKRRNKIGRKRNQLGYPSHHQIHFFSGSVKSF